MALVKLTLNTMLSNGTDSHGQDFELHNKTQGNKCKRIIISNFNKLFPCSRYSTYPDYIHRFLNSWCTHFFFIFGFCLTMFPPLLLPSAEWNGNLSSSNKHKNKERNETPLILQISPTFLYRFSPTNGESEVNCLLELIFSSFSAMHINHMCIYYHLLYS